MTGNENTARWINGLSDEDLMFIKRFVLTSGSLKALAEDYGVSYPTIRLRLDRLIDKVKVLDDNGVQGQFERTARALYADGRLELRTLRDLLRAHREEMGADT